MYKKDGLREKRGITIISLVVTIIVLIILAGVSINLTVGENGIITMAKQAKENIELAKIEEETKLNELYMQIETDGGISGDGSYDAIVKLTEFKRAIADYIEEAGGVKPEYTAEATTFGESIKGIVKEVTKDTTATADHIEKGYTAYIKGELVTGTKSSNDTDFNKLTCDFYYTTATSGTGAGYRFLKKSSNTFSESVYIYNNPTQAKGDVLSVTYKSPNFTITTLKDCYISVNGANFEKVSSGYSVSHPFSQEYKIMAFSF